MGTLGNQKNQLNAEIIKLSKLGYNPSQRSPKELSVVESKEINSLHEQLITFSPIKTQYPSSIDKTSKTQSK